ncbi:ArsR family transcriptional regulator [Nostocoides sp. F2B08]|uniref:helix-turn-helix transcriptional regulator n=1 Tax=Nostocoides sp. F2B08 TaxID=2653936 RepID=UPI001262B720|nr:helix-turn-helix transcriptional regulator [Tetrasphaera sp. F2B08]KAB7744812.1 ArsR family transcriptional regulator [Tetrasphaera sp. F2B08]
MTEAHRLAELEARVDRLERSIKAAVAAREPDGGADLDPDVFWALLGLESRVQEPGAVMIVGSAAAPSGVRARWQLSAGSDELLDEDWSMPATRLAALGHPVRLRIAQQVLRGVDTVRGLTAVEGMGTSGQVYHHVRELTAAGWLRNRGSHLEVPAEVMIPLLSAVLGARR